MPAAEPTQFTIRVTNVGGGGVDTSPGVTHTLTYRVDNLLNAEQVVQLKSAAPGAWTVTSPPASVTLTPLGSLTLTLDATPGGGTLVGSVFLQATGVDGKTLQAGALLRTPVGVRLVLDRASFAFDEPVRGNVTLTYLNGAPGADLALALSETLRANAFSVGAPRNSGARTALDGRAAFSLPVEATGANTPGNHSLVAEVVALRSSSASVRYTVEPSPRAHQDDTCTGAFVGPTANPLVNADFDVGYPTPVETTGPLGDAMSGGSGLAPGTIERDAKLVAPGWSVFRDHSPETPASVASWVGAGGNDPSRLRLQYSAADVGLKALAVAQAVGSPIAGSAWCGATAVELNLRNDKAILVAAALYTKERPQMPFITGPVTLEPSAWRTLTLPIPAGAETVTQVRLLFHDAGASDGAVVELDAVRLLGTHAARVATP